MYSIPVEVVLKVEALVGQVRGQEFARVGLIREEVALQRVDIGSTRIEHVHGLDSDTELLL
jgi:hypothetical protein